MKLDILQVCILCLACTVAGAQDSLRFSGQLSSWIHYNPSNDLPLWAGARLIPELNAGLMTGSSGILDMEASANLYGSAGFLPFDSLHDNARLKAYRLWGRYSSQHLELRIGLQKLNFGSATLFRPLMWFDQLDPRDPLQLTDGVWGILGRYYFMNNATLWLWGLYGNEKPRGWEIAETNEKYPEAGGRFQFPLPRGEAAFSYHRRLADVRDFDIYYVGSHWAKVPENRFGIDAKVDVGVGLWLEASWTRKSRDLGLLTNQEILNAGMDYTFGLGGRGLTMLVEQVVMAYDERAFAFQETVSFTGLSLSYAAGLLDNINAIFYYDWKNDNIYNFVNWRRTWDNIILYLMAYWNPKDFNIPVQERSEMLYAGKGLQLIMALNF